MSEYLISWGWSKARIWSGGLPDFETIPTIFAERDYPQSSLVRTGHAFVGLEIFLAQGGKFGYGLLGAEYKPEDGDQLTVRVPVNEVSGDRLDWAISSRMIEPRQGLPPEYTSSVFEGVERYLATSCEIGGGTLCFSHSVHSNVGSSISLFRNISSSLVEIIAKMPMDELDMAKIAEKWCTKAR